jgi:hypothetical protein
MSPLPIAILLFLGAIAVGVWRRFGPVQWIWLLFGFAMALVVVWVLMLVLVIGPEMQRMGPPGR